MDLIFTKTNNDYIAEYTAATHFNLHIEGGGRVYLYKRTSGERGVLIASMPSKDVVDVDVAVNHKTIYTIVLKEKASFVAITTIDGEVINGVIQEEGGDNTPDGSESKYWFVDYLESDGTQVIDTEYLLKEEDVITLNYRDLQAVDTDSFMFGNKDESGEKTVGTWLSVYGKSAILYARFGGSTSTKTGIDLLNDTQVVLQKSLVSTASKSATLSFRGMPTLTLAVFGRKDNSDTYSQLGAKFKFNSMTIVSGNEVKLDLRPVVRKSDNKAGLLDMITKAFFVNKGTGNDFIVGDIIEQD